MDVKNGGLEEWDKYKHLFMFSTLTVRTMSGGLHFYFKYESSDPETAYLIKNFLKSASKYRGKGLDIKTNGGQAVAPGSSGSVFRRRPRPSD